MAGRRKAVRARRLGLDRCPRCGLPVDNIYSKQVGNRVYYYAYHSGGKQCYLGPQIYEYVNRTHNDVGVTLRGALDNERIIDYIEELLNNLNVEELTESQARRIIRLMAKVMRAWQLEKKRREQEKEEEEEIDAVREWEEYNRKQGGRA